MNLEESAECHQTLSMGGVCAQTCSKRTDIQIELNKFFIVVREVLCNNYRSCNLIGHYHVLFTRRFSSGGTHETASWLPISVMGIFPLCQFPLHQRWPYGVLYPVVSCTDPTRGEGLVTFSWFLRSSLKIHRLLYPELQADSWFTCRVNPDLAKQVWHEWNAV